MYMHVQMHAYETMKTTVDIFMIWFEDSYCINDSKFKKIKLISIHS